MAWWPVAETLATFVSRSKVGACEARFSGRSCLFLIAAVGDKRAHENPALLSLSIMFMRYHNSVAKKLAAEPRPKNDPNKPTDRDLFEKAQAKTIAVMQVGYSI